MNPNLTLDLLMLRAPLYSKYSVRMTPEEMKALRKSLDLTQVELAERLEVEPNTVARWEQGLVKISKVVELAVKSLKKKS